MTSEEAKKILSFYRPGTADAEDPTFAEALALAQPAPANARWLGGHDPDLTKWFEEHCASYTAVQARFAQIPVPAGLKEQILAERNVSNVVRLPLSRKRFTGPLLALAAAVAVLLCALTFAMRPAPGPDPLTACRNQMVRLALMPYFMDRETADQDQIRSYLAQRSAPANYVLPAHIGAAQIVGCGVKSWENTPVSMICFRSGQPLKNGDQTDLWLFVVDNSTLAGVSLPTSPAYMKVSRAMTATWSAHNRTYILVGDGDKSFLEQYLD